MPVPDEVVIVARPGNHAERMEVRFQIAAVRDRIMQSMTDLPGDVDGRLALYAEHDKLVRTIRGGLL